MNIELFLSCVYFLSENINVDTLASLFKEFELFASLNFTFSAKQKHSFDLKTENYSIFP